MPIDFDRLLGNLIGLKALYSNTLRDFWDFLREKNIFLSLLIIIIIKITRYYIKVSKKVKSKTIKAFKGLKSGQKGLKINSRKAFRHTGIKATASRTAQEGQ